MVLRRISNHILWILLLVTAELDVELHRLVSLFAIDERKRYHGTILQSQTLRRLFKTPVSCDLDPSLARLVGIYRHAQEHLVDGIGQRDWLWRRAGCEARGIPLSERLEEFGLE